MNVLETTRAASFDLVEVNGWRAQQPEAMIVPDSRILSSERAMTRRLILPHE